MTGKWIQTDNSETSYQFVKKNSDKNFEFIEAVEIGEEGIVRKGIIDLEDYSKDEIEKYISSYYKNLDSLQNSYKNNISVINQIIAECIFEQIECETIRRFQDIHSAIEYTNNYVKSDEEEYINEEIKIIQVNELLNETKDLGMQKGLIKCLNNYPLIEGRIKKAKYAFQKTVSIRPIEHNYANKNEPKYIKYVCPICQALGNSFQLSEGMENCPLCNVNLLWN